MVGVWWGYGGGLVGVWWGSIILEITSPIPVLGSLHRQALAKLQTIRILRRQNPLYYFLPQVLS